MGRRTDNINRRFSELTEKSSKIVKELSNAFSIVPKFKDVEQAMIDFSNNSTVKESTSVEDRMISLMARQMNDDIDNKLLYRIDNNGDMIIPGCVPAKFRDSPGTKNALRKTVKHMLPIGTDFNTALEELKEKPVTIHETLENLINRHRIDNES